MTVWAILDSTSTIINVYDDGGKNTAPATGDPHLLGKGVLSVDISTLPHGAWTGWQQINGDWYNDIQVAAMNPQQAVIAQANALTKAQMQTVITALQAKVAAV